MCKKRLLAIIVPCVVICVAIAVGRISNTESANSNIVESSIEKLSTSNQTSVVEEKFDLGPETVVNDGPEPSTLSLGSDEYSVINSNEIDTTEENTLLYEADVAILDVNHVTASAGDSNVEVSISISNNPGVLAMLLSVSYDESVMTMTSVTNGSAVSDVLTLTSGNNLVSGCNFLWDGIEILDEDIHDGEILTMTFDILPNIPSGQYEINVVSVDENMIDNDLEVVSSIINGGGIEIEN